MKPFTRLSCAAHDFAEVKKLKKERKKQTKKNPETSFHNHFLSDVTRTSGGLEANITPRNLHSKDGQSLKKKMHSLVLLAWRSRVLSF